MSENNETSNLYTDDIETGDSQVERSETKIGGFAGTYWAGILGAFCGGVVGVIIWALLAAIIGGTLPFMFAIFLPFFIIGGYKILKGKMSAGGMTLTVSIATLVFVFVGLYLTIPLFVISAITFLNNYMYFQTLAGFQMATQFASLGDIGKIFESIVPIYQIYVGAGMAQILDLSWIESLISVILSGLGVSIFLRNVKFDAEPVDIGEEAIEVMFDEDNVEAQAEGFKEERELEAAAEKTEE